MATDPLQLVTKFNCFFLVPPVGNRNMDARIRERAACINHQVGEEDVDFCHWTHEGVRSSSYEGGILSDLETGVRDFAEAVRERIPVARCAKAPPLGEVTRVNETMLSKGSRSRGAKHPISSSASVG